MSPVRFLVTPRKESLIVTTKLSAIFLFAVQQSICGKILDLTICNPWPRQPKAHKKRKRLRDYVSAIKRKQGELPCYSFVHLSGRRSRYASEFEPGGKAAVLLSTSDR